MAAARLIAKDRPLRAAQYVRMSTDMQEYSTESQKRVIAEYAKSRGIEIVATYADEGRSGLNLQGRPALQRLLGEVAAGTPAFDAILVYDVSRWGRFQDVDESAYYEYLCRQKGVQVLYCAEPFPVDGGGALSSVFKAMKRAMAAEYSRELSVKTTWGLCRYAELGYWVGAPAGFGLRRAVLDQEGRAKVVLHRGEYKSIRSEHVVLIPGPASEVELVRQIYAWYVDDGLTREEILKRLQELGLRSDTGRAWSVNVVRDILTNEKYVGSAVYNRTSSKLLSPRVLNPPSMWVRKEGAYEGIVSPETFKAAQAQRLSRRRHRVTDAVLLDKLRSLLDRHGYLSCRVLKGVCRRTYHKHFGSLTNAYQLIGYTPTIDCCHAPVRRRFQPMYQRFLRAVASGVVRAGGRIEPEPGAHLLRLNDSISMAVTLACALTLKSARGMRGWLINMNARVRPADLYVIARTDLQNQSIQDYLALPRQVAGSRKYIYILASRPDRLHRYCFGHIDDLCAALARATAASVHSAQPLLGPHGWLVAQQPSTGRPPSGSPSRSMQTTSTSNASLVSQHAGRPDGRRERGNANRTRMSEAFLALVVAGVVRPTAEAVAQHAGVGLRSVFRHFSDMETLYRELVTHAELVLDQQLTRAQPEINLLDSVDDVVSHRASIYERLLPLQLAVRANLHESEHLREYQRGFAKWQRTILTKSLPKNLLKDKDLLEALDLALSFDTWVRLRRVQQLAKASAKRVVALTCSALLRDRAASVA